MATLSLALSLILLAIYLAWGVYTLRLRFVKHEELSFTTEAVTVALVLVFYVVELSLHRVYMQDSTLLYLGTGLALVVSGAALYGPMVVSLIARVFVDALHPVDAGEVQAPHYGPAEALERVGKYEGAVGEYRVIARIFPKDPEPLLRAAECWIELRELENATADFERAMRLLDDPERVQVVANRVADIYARDLDQPDRAEKVLTDFLTRFPDAEHRAGIERRLERLHRAPEPAARATVSEALEIPGESSE
jgi:tetratricopeptide (TPR) repeat protein